MVDRTECGGSDRETQTDTETENQRDKGVLVGQNPAPAAPSLAEYLDDVRGGRSALRWYVSLAGCTNERVLRDAAGDDGENAQFMRWAERVASGEYASSGAFRSQCALRHVWQQAEMVLALDNYRCAIERVEAHRLFDTLQQQRVENAGLRKKVAGLRTSAKPNLEAKLAQATEELRVAEERERKITAGMGATWHAYELADTAIVEVEQQYSHAVAAAAAQGKRSSDICKRKAGKALEAAGLPDDFVRHICSCTHGLGSGDQTHRPARTYALSNVTLGAGDFELDWLVIVPDTGTSVADSLTSCDASEPEPEPEPESEPEPEPVVRALVVGIVEAKSNPNDIGVSFQHFQSTIAWLTGSQADYSPSVYRNKTHKTGHFVRGEHLQDGIRFVFSPASFRLLKRRSVQRTIRQQQQQEVARAEQSPEDAVVYVDRVHYITSSKPLVDVDSKLLQRTLISKLGASMALSVSLPVEEVNSSGHEGGDTKLRLHVVQEHFGSVARHARARAAASVVKSLEGLPLHQRTQLLSVVGIDQSDDTPFTTVGSASETDRAEQTATGSHSLHSSAEERVRIADSIDGFWCVRATAAAQPQPGEDQEYTQENNATQPCQDAYLPVGIIPAGSDIPLTPIDASEWRWVHRQYLSLLAGGGAQRQTEIAAHKLRMKIIKQCLATERVIATVLLSRQQQQQEQPSLPAGQEATQLCGRGVADAACDTSGIASVAEMAAEKFVEKWRVKLDEAQAERRWLASEVLSLFASIGLPGNVHFAM